MPAVHRGFFVRLVHLALFANLSETQAVPLCDLLTRGGTMTADDVTCLRCWAIVLCSGTIVPAIQWQHVQFDAEIDT